MSKPAATEAEVKRAIEQATNVNNGFRPVSAPELAGLVAGFRGCPDSWPTADTIRQYVAISSVKAVLQRLADKGELWPVKGNHWGINQYRHRNTTFWLTPEAKAQAIVKMEARSRERIALSAIEKATEAVVLAHQEEFQQNVDNYIASIPVTKWEEKW